MRKTLVAVAMLAVMLLWGCAATTPAVTGVTAENQAYIERELGTLALTMASDQPATMLPVYAQLREFVTARPKVFGAALAYAPGMAPGTTVNLAAPYVWRDGNVIREKDMSRNGDYTSVAVPWFSEPVRRGTPCWSDPYYDTLGAGAQVRMVTYSIPLYTSARTPVLVGVLTADVFLDRR